MVEIHFHIPYKTNCGESISVAAVVFPQSIPYHINMDTTDGINWQGTIVVDEICDSIQYEYVVQDSKEISLRKEQGLIRRCIIDRRRKIHLFDSWMDAPEFSIFSRSGLANCICNREDGVEVKKELLQERHLLLLKALPPKAGWRWAVVGNKEKWGNWNPRKARMMLRTDTFEWGVPISSEDFDPSFRYKFIWVKSDGSAEVKWEEREDRALYAAFADSELKGSTIQTDFFPRMTDKKDLWRGAGVVIPVFSLRSEGSFGVGDFGDLKLFIKWVSSVGMNVVQLLPINDTTTTGGHRDSYPYSAISVFALHPIYFDPRSWKSSKTFKKYKDQGSILNQSKSLDYDNVYQTKIKFLRDLYVEKKSSLTRTKSYKAFCHDNQDWLKSYSDFCACRDMYHTANFRHWPVCETDKVKLEQIEADRSFYTFVQYLLHIQLLDVAETARQLGVILKGDIPIGICRDSVPARQDAHLFHFNGQAGAPPDAFALSGQNWGFPTYNWEEMAKDNYSWWRRRLQHIGQYFDAYRIDHVLGFFRIWEIPYQHLYGTLGYFRPAKPLQQEEAAKYGFTLPMSCYSSPLLVDNVLSEIKLHCSENEFKRFVIEDQSGVRLRNEFQSQRYIVENIEEGDLRNILMKAATEVLFIEDYDAPGFYHPRISAQETELYKSLSEVDRIAFDKLYEDFYYYRHNDFWAAEALKKIPSIINYAWDSTYPIAADGGMLPCAEDLGMIPSSVKGVLEQLSILSLEIQRMPKQYGVRFGNPMTYPYLSVATPGTHDMSPFRLWWHENAEQTQAYWNDALGRGGNAPSDAPSDACEQMIAQHFKSPSMLCLIALQDLLAIDQTLCNPDIKAEQINDPSNPHHYWCYRMHVTIEQLISYTPFSEKLRGLIQMSGRGIF
jgi:4-alpha-glucanotransferase